MLNNVRERILCWHVQDDRIAGEGPPPLSCQISAVEVRC
jgi:hypothetical protein